MLLQCLIVDTINVALNQVFLTHVVPQYTQRVSKPVYGVSKKGILENIRLVILINNDNSVIYLLRMKIESPYNSVVCSSRPDFSL